jgi:2-amino-4-hydroxy-6-hydroxymethyldihydropteridine diphosphokinase
LHRAYVGIGTNLGDRLGNAERALAALQSLGSIARISSWYRTEPWGKRDQPWFLNAVAALETAFEPRILLQRMKAIEKEVGRTRGEHWGPRIIDLDLLAYDDIELAEPDLQLPHPLLRERAFVLVPLSEIDARFTALRDALPPVELAGVVRVERESVANMSEEGSIDASERVRVLARFLNENELARVRVRRGDEDIEITAVRLGVGTQSEHSAAADVPAQRVDTIKADIVGVFHASRPMATEGDTFEADRELGYIEALGIRTPVHSMGSGRLLAVTAVDGEPVEYGQPLFAIARR